MAVVVPPYEKLHEFLRDIRSKIFETTPEAGEFFGISHSSISRYETGRVRPPFKFVVTLIYRYEQHYAEYHTIAHDVRKELLDRLNAIKDECYAREKFVKSWGDVELLAQKYVSAKNRKNKIRISANNRDRTDKQGNNETFFSLPPSGIEIFIGREKDVGLLKEKITSRKERQSHFTIIYGAPGIGKTALLKELAKDEKVQKKFKDGILWVAFEPDTEPLAAAQEIGQKLNDSRLSSAENIKVAHERLSEYLQERSFLLLVDDVWSEKQGKPFRISSSSSHICFTTREPSLANRLAAIPSEDVFKLDVLLPVSSYELFNKLAPAVVRNYPEKSAFLVEKLDGSPLAIRVAAGLLTVEHQLGFDISELLDDLVEGDKLLQANAPLDRSKLDSDDAPSIASLLNQSYQRLSSERKIQFASLGVFAAKSASFSLDALMVILDINDPKPVIRDLFARGLVEPVGNERYCIHFLLNRFAYNQLDFEQCQIFQTRHAKYYLKTLQAAENEFGEFIKGKSTELMENEMPNILKAVRWVNANSREGQINNQIGIDFALCSQVLGQYLAQDKFVKLLNHAIENCNNAYREVDLWRKLGAFNIAKGSLDDAKIQIDRALELARKIDYEQSLSRCWGYLGDINRRLTLYDEAIDCYTEAIAFAKQTNNYKEVGGHTGSLGVAYRQLRKFKKSEECLLKALEVAKEVDDYRSAALWNGHLGYLNYVNNDLDGAIEKTQEAATMMQQNGNLYEESLHQGNLGFFLLQAGKIEEAVAQCQFALEKCREAVNPLSESDSLDNLGCAYQLLEAYVQAEQCFREAIEIAKKTHNKEKEYEFRKNLGKLFLKCAPLKGNEILDALFEEMKAKSSQNYTSYLREVQSYRLLLED